MANQIFKSVSLNILGDGSSITSTIDLGQFRDFAINSPNTIGSPASITNVNVTGVGVSSGTPPVVTASVVSRGEAVQFTFTPAIGSGITLNMNINLLATI